MNKEQQSAGAALPLTIEQIEALPIWKRFVGLWPETRKEISDAVIAKFCEINAIPPASPQAGEVNRPSAEWYQAKIMETLDDDFVIGPAPTPAQMDAASGAGEWWPNVEAAMADPLFQRARGIMGTENWFQDNALRNVINHVLEASFKTLRAENEKLRKDIGEMVRSDADATFAALAAAPQQPQAQPDAKVQDQQNEDQQRTGEIHQSDARHGSHDAGRTGGEGRPSAHQRDEHRSRKTGADRAHDQSTGRRDGIHGACDVSAKVDATPPASAAGEREALTDEQRLDWALWRIKDLEQKLSAALSSSPAPVQPIDMVLFCPNCGKQHIDAPDWMPVASKTEFAPLKWDNPPHRSHLCHSCGTIWRPADVPTNGVEHTQTKGKADTWVSAQKVGAA